MISMLNCDFQTVCVIVIFTFLLLLIFIFVLLNAGHSLNEKLEMLRQYLEDEQNVREDTRESLCFESLRKLLKKHKFKPYKQKIDHDCRNVIPIAVSNIVNE